MPGYSLVYHPRLATQAKARIRKSMELKLTSRPELYGLPLRGTLQRLWKLRVGDYRVVYSIVGSEVRVLVIAHRREVYELAKGR